MLEESRYYLTKAAKVLDLSARIREILMTPRRVVKVELVTEADDGELLPHRISGSAQRGPGSNEGRTPLSPYGR